MTHLRNDWLFTLLTLLTLLPLLLSLARTASRSYCISQERLARINKEEAAVEITRREATADKKEAEEALSLESIGCCVGPKGAREEEIKIKFRAPHWLLDAEAGTCTIDGDDKYWKIGFSEVMNKVGNTLSQPQTYCPTLSLAYSDSLWLTLTLFGLL